MWNGTMIRRLVLALALLLVAASAHAAVLVQSKTGNVHPNTTLGVTWTSNTTSGNLVCVVVLNTFTSTGGSTFSVSDSQSNTYTQAITTEDGFNDQFSVVIFYAKNITGGTTPTVTVTHANSGEYAALIMEFSGLDTTAPLDATNYSRAVSTTPTTGNAVLSTSGVAVIGLSTNGAGSVTVNGGWTSLLNNLGGTGDASYQIGGAATYNGGWTVSNAFDPAAIAVFKDAAATATPRTRTLMGVGK